jgi:hypothetical protein
MRSPSLLPIRPSRLVDLLGGEVLIEEEQDHEIPRVTQADRTESLTRLGIGGDDVGRDLEPFDSISPPSDSIMTRSHCRGRLEPEDPRGLQLAYLP